MNPDNQKNKIQKINLGELHEAAYENNDILPHFSGDPVINELVLNTNLLDHSEISDEARNKWLHQEIMTYRPSRLFEDIFKEFNGIDNLNKDKSKAREKFKKQIQRIPNGTGAIKDPVLFLKILEKLNISNMEYILGKRLGYHETNESSEKVKSEISKIRQDIYYIKKLLEPKKKIKLENTPYIIELRFFILETYFNRFNLLFLKIRLPFYFFNGHTTVIEVINDFIIDKLNQYPFFYNQILKQHENFKELIPIKELRILPLLTILKKFINDRDDYVDSNKKIFQIPITFIALDLIITLYFLCHYTYQYIKILSRRGLIEESHINEIVLLLNNILDVLEEPDYSENIDYRYIFNYKENKIKPDFIQSISSLIYDINKLISIKSYAFMTEKVNNFKNNFDNPYVLIYPDTLEYKTDAEKDWHEKENYFNSNAFPFYKKENLPSNTRKIVVDKITLNEINDDFKDNIDFLTETYPEVIKLFYKPESETTLSHIDTE